ncbi:MAG: hypothetical protein AB7T37_08840 [Dehalococcoidia bacterium]
MVLGTILLLDSALPDAALEDWKQVCADFARFTGGDVELVTGDRGALALLASALAATPAVWTRQSLEADTAPPPPMTAAPFLFKGDGRPDWAAMWTNFCDLALYGGPPHRGPDNPVRAGFAPSPSDFDAVGEIRRGIFETTGLFAERAEDGWLALTCTGPAMAAWMCTCIILENVEARCEGDRLFVPASPAFELKNEVKSVVTVTAKVHHYWEAHIESMGTAAMAQAI